MPIILGGIKKEIKSENKENNEYVNTQKMCSFIIWVSSKSAWKINLDTFNLNPHFYGWVKIKESTSH